MWANGNIIFDNSMCRFCGCTNKKVHSIQSDQDPLGCNENNSIYQLVRRLVPLKIEPEDQKPQNVCSDCVGTLERYDTFISTCIANDIAFDNALQNMKTGDAARKKCVDVKQMVTEDGKMKSGNDQNIFLLNKMNELSNVENENFYIIVELNCKGLNIEPVLIKCNEKKNVVIETKGDEDNVQGDSKSNMHANNTEVPETNRKSDVKIKPYKCTVCNKSLTRKSNLTSHLALHSKERPHKCNECGKNFAIFADLTLHKHIHSQSFACEICKKCFVTKSKLERHEKSHTGVKEHACPMCKKRFAEKNNMLAHMSVHTGERPFSCSICKKSFRTQSHLTDHGKVHSNESPFQCTICNKSFKWKSNLKDHNKFHSGEKFKCNDCNKEFNVRTDYYKHRKECREEKNQLEEGFL